MTRGHWEGRGPDLPGPQAGQGKESPELVAPLENSRTWKREPKKAGWVRVWNWRRKSRFLSPGGQVVEQVVSEVDEVALLAGGTEGLQAGGGGRFPHAGEVEVGGEVALARGVEGVVPGPVPGVGLQGAAGAGGVAVVAMLPVVEGQLHEAGKGEWAFLFDEGAQDMVQ